MENSGWTLVVAMASNGVIGRDGTLPWRLSSDLKRFKEMTMGHCLLMGRITYESIGRPLPGRQTIVLSRTMDLELPDNVALTSDICRVDDLVDDGRQVMVVGGAQIYSAALMHCSTIWLTRVMSEVDGDTHFPNLEWEQWDLESTQAFSAGPKDDFATQFEVWRRKKGNVHESS